MRLEDVPPILGALVALLGLWLLWDAVVADREPRPARERRRRARADRDRPGEAALGLGTLGLAAALIGRDTWRYTNVAVLLGAILLLVGIALNWRFLRELLVFRGPARRQVGRTPRGEEADRYADGAADGAAAPAAAPPDAPRDGDDGPLRIR